MPLRELMEEFGPRATDSAFEREFYARDLAYVPDFLLNLLARPVPDAVVRPVTAEEVSSVLRWAAREDVPVTARGGGSTAYGNAVPARGGIVLDLNGLQGVREIDPAAGRAWVAAGTTWLELDRELGRHGLAICAYPSSAPSATVGGWISMGGLGIGSLRYGPVESLLEELEVVLPDGRILRATGETEPPLGWFCGAEGTLGVVTGARLRLRARPEAEGHCLAEGGSLAQLAELAASLVAELGPVLFNLHANTGAYNRWLAAAGHGGSGKPTLSVDFDGSRVEVERAEVAVRALAGRAGGALLSPDEAREEWEGRFESLRVKRERPALLGAEMRLPLGRFSSYAEGCDALARRQKLEIATYGHVVSPAEVVAMSLYPTDERRTARYLLDTSLLRELYGLGARLGGAPYAIGLWNTPYLGNAWSPQELAEKRRRKARLDPKGLLNPGKYYAAPLLLSPALFSVGMRVFSSVRRLAPSSGGRR
ncbi:MAG: FAD-binding oxidoreductase [Deltaproteobacteria bacterium]|nr:FAD-binding oxidoreductase [Deltaproteobacteria bacterium]